MIDLRWLKRTVTKPTGMMFFDGSGKTTPGMMTFQETILQCRESMPTTSVLEAFAIEQKWGDWKDVPTVEGE